MPRGQAVYQIELYEYINGNHRFQDLVARADAEYLTARGVGEQAFYNYLEGVFRESGFTRIGSGREGRDFVITVHRAVGALPPDHVRNPFAEDEFAGRNPFFNRFRRVVPNPLSDARGAFEDAEIEGLIPHDGTTYNREASVLAILRGGLARYDVHTDAVVWVIHPIQVQFPGLAVNGLDNVELTFFMENRLRPAGNNNDGRARREAAGERRNFYRYDTALDGRQYVVTSYIRPRAPGWNVAAILAGAAVTGGIILVCYLRRKKQN